MHTLKNFYSIALLFVIGLSISSCENDVDLNTEYREVTMVDGSVHRSSIHQNHQSFSNQW